MATIAPIDHSPVRVYRRVALGAALCWLLASCATPPPAPRVTVPPVKSTEPTKPQPMVDDLRLMQEAQRFIQNNQPDMALIRFRTLVEQFPKSTLIAEALFKQAGILQQRGEWEQAQGLLEQAARQTASPFADQAAARLSELRAKQGGAQETWRFWTEQFGTAPMGSLPQDKDAWRQLIETYLNIGDANNTEFFVRTLANGLQPGQVRILLQSCAQLPAERLTALLALQPPASPITPYLHIALGDRLAQAGLEKAALEQWSAVLNDPLALQEAAERLRGNPQTAPLQVGLLLPLSGRYEALGENILLATQSAVSAYRDAPMVLHVADSGGTAEASRQAMTRLAAEGVQVVIGPVFRPAAAAAAPVAIQAAIPLLTLNPNQDVAALDARYGPDRLVFLNAFQPDRQARSMAQYAFNNAGRRRFAILAPDSDYGRLTAEGFRSEATRLGASVVRELYFPAESTDLSSWIRKLSHVDAESLERRRNALRAARALDPSEPPPLSGGNDAWSDFDALFLPTRAEQARLVAPQLASFNLVYPHVLLLGTALWNRPELLKEGTDYLSGAVFCDAEPWPVKEFENAFTTTWGKAPVSIASLAYDAVAALGQLLREQRMQGPSWRLALTRPEGFMGTSGQFRLLPDGGSERLLHYYHIEKSGIVTRNSMGNPPVPQTPAPDSTPAPQRPPGT